LTPSETAWRRVETEEMFRQAVADKTLTSEGMRFVIHSDGRITGRIGSSVLTGRWHWRDGYFCRTAELDGEDLGLDCEIIEMLGNRMRYTRDKGNGETSVVFVE